MRKLFACFVLATALALNAIMPAFAATQVDPICSWQTVTASVVYDNTTGIVAGAQTVNTGTSNVVFTLEVYKANGQLNKRLTQTNTVVPGTTFYDLSADNIQMVQIGGFWYLPVSVACGG